MTGPEDDGKGEEIEYIGRTPGEADASAAPAAPAGGVDAVPKAPLPGAGEEARHLKAKKREAELKDTRRERDGFRDQYLRAAAEMENLRKRSERDKAEYTQFALSDLLLELLGVLDNFERALGAAEAAADGQAVRSGIDLIYRMFQAVLFKRGVRPIEIKDRVFDPNLHHAMITEESEAVSEPEVSEELQKGYMLHARLLRPSLVKVIVPKKA